MDARVAIVGRPLLALALTAAPSGCSRLFMASPAEIAKHPVGCTTDQFVPGLDVAMSYVAASGSVLGVMGLLAALGGYGDAVPLIGVGVVFAGLAVEFGASASFGYASARACQQTMAPPHRGAAPMTTHRP
jgi:hypothetical protein